MICEVIMILALLTCIALGWLLKRALKRLFEFDDLFQYLADDMNTNIRFFTRLESTPLLSNAPEIVEAHKNMNIMNVRLREYALRMEEMTGRKLLMDGKNR